VTLDFTERVRAIPPQRLDLLLRRLNALRPAPAGGAPVAREPLPSGPLPGTWLAEPVLVPLRFFGALDGVALQRALDVLGAQPPALHVLDFRERPLEGRYGEVLRAAGTDAASPAPVRAVLARLDEAEHLLVLVLHAAADTPPASALAGRLQARYAELVRRPPAEPETPQPPRPPLPAQSAADLLAEVESFSDEDVELLLGQLQTGASLQVARPANVPVDPASAEALLAEIDQLADADVDALLRQLSDV
jgi:hypothetical protein